MLVLTPPSERKEPINPSVFSVPFLDILIFREFEAFLRCPFFSQDIEYSNEKLSIRCEAVRVVLRSLPPTKYTTSKRSALLPCFFSGNPETGVGSSGLEKGPIIISS